ncbi:MAG: DUF1638 domain-containing protein, partial [Anaerolineae bacterium]
LRAIACEVLARPLYLAAVYSPHVVDFDLVDKGLHNEPDTLRNALQQRIDAVDESRYDAIVLGYALCSNSTAGLVARGRPLVLPRAHDCITLYLGSRAAYAAEFNDHPGTYYYTADYFERNSDGSVVLGATSESSLRRSYDEFVEKYGEENAAYLMEVMGGWRQHYNRAAFIAMGVGSDEKAAEAARKEAEKNGWTFEQIQGNAILLRKLIHGEWDDDFLQVAPGQAIAVTYDENIVRSCPYVRRDE